MISTLEQTQDLVPYQITIAVDGASEDLGVLVGRDAPGGWVLQVPSGKSTVVIGASGVSATATDAAHGIELAAGAAPFETHVRSLVGWHAVGTSTNLTILGRVART